MQQQLAEWLAWNSQKNDLFFSFAQDKKIDTLMGLLGDQVLSLAELVGDNKTQLLQTDNEINDLFKQYGAKDTTFIQKLQASPVTGMATILYACQNRAGFLPNQGEYSLAKFNQFISNLTRCPLISIGDNKSFTAVGTFTDKNKVMPDSITENFLFDDGTENNKILRDQIQKCLNRMGNNSYKLDIYNMELAGAADAYLNIRAGVVEITCTADKLSYKFSASAKGFNIKLVMSGINWSNSAPQIINTFSFAPISQWIEVTNLP